MLRSQFISYFLGYAVENISSLECRRDLGDQVVQALDARRPAYTGVLRMSNVVFKFAARRIDVTLAVSTVLF